MIWNFFLLSLRHIARHKSYVFINIAGLSIGLACSIIIGLFVIHELSYDKFNEKKDQIYRLYLKGKIGESELQGAWTCSPLGPVLHQEYPEVVDFCRINNWGETVLKYNNKGYIENNFAEADSSFFRIFSIPLLKGDPNRVLTAKHELVLSESTATKIFGEVDPMGKTIQVGNDTSYYTVCGVMADIPDNAHFNYTVLASFITNPRAIDPTWLSNSFSTYVLLNDPAAAEGLQKKLPELVEKYVGPEVEKFLGINLDQFAQAGNSYGFYLQSLSDIHLNPSIQHDQKPTNDKKYIYIFSLVAILILIMASINYTNLATARSAGRALEIGIRKIVGSERKTLIWQFLMESFMLTILSLFIALLLIELLLPVVNNTLGIALKIGYLDTWYTLPVLFGMAIILGFMAGTYPSFFLSSFRPISVLNQSKKSSTTGKSLRNILVVLQLTGSVFLIFISLLIYRQVQFMLNTQLGYDKNNLLILQRAGTLEKNLIPFVGELKRLPGVEQVCHSTAIPNYPNNHNGYQIEGMPKDQTYLMQTFYMDYEFIPTYKLEVTQGRNFSQDFGSDSSSCIINEMAVKQFGLKDPLKTRVLWPQDQGTFKALNVIGVIKDFHYASLHERIYPCVFIPRPSWGYWGYISIRYNPKSVESTLKEVEKLWNQFTVNDPIVYFFMDKDYKKLYKEDIRTGVVALSFSVLAIIIASLGLFGLTSFTTEQRTKEIGIRKAAGASTLRIMLLLLRNVIWLILIATGIAWAAGYFFAQMWLQNFYFKTSLSVWEFVISLGTVGIISVLTIVWQSYRAASTNPAQALKYE